MPFNSPHYTQSRIQKPNQVLLSSLDEIGLKGVSGHLYHDYAYKNIIPIAILQINFRLF